MVHGKKLFLWQEVLVLMDRSPLPEGRGSKDRSEKDGFAYR